MERNRPLPKKEQEATLANSSCLHDLATYCFVDYGQKRRLKQLQVCFDDHINAWLKSVFPLANDKLIKQAKQTIVKDLRERERIGIINLPDSY